MPLFYQHTINQSAKLGIWKIEETESFFLQKVPAPKNITHPHKRLQHLAGRYLLQYLFPKFPYGDILIAHTRKPYLQNEQYHFSISHCGNFAAAIVSSVNRVGIDVEIAAEKIAGIAHKFIHQSEQKLLTEFDRERIKTITAPQTKSYQLQTILWGAKESIFKWYSLGSVNFKEHIQLCNISRQHKNLLLSFVFKKTNPVQLYVTTKIFDELVLSWVIN